MNWLDKSDYIIVVMKHWNISATLAYLFGFLDMNFIVNAIKTITVTFNNLSKDLILYRIHLSIDHVISSFTKLYEKIDKNKVLVQNKEYLIS